MSRTGCTPSTLLKAQVEAAATRVQELRDRLHRLEQQLLAEGSTPQRQVRCTLDQLYEVADELAHAEAQVSKFLDS